MALLVWDQNAVGVQYEALEEQCWVAVEGLPLPFSPSAVHELWALAGLWVGLWALVGPWEGLWASAGPWEGPSVFGVWAGLLEV